MGEAAPRGKMDYVTDFFTVHKRAQSRMADSGPYCPPLRSTDYSEMIESRGSTTPITDFPSAKLIIEPSRESVTYDRNSPPGPVVVAVCNELKPRSWSTARARDVCAAVHSAACHPIPLILCAVGYGYL